MDVAVIGLMAHSEPIDDATRSLDRMTVASKKTDAANKQRVVSDKAAAAAAKANAMANNALASSSKAAAFRQRQLAVQSLDVAQSLALGMPPMMVAIQQGGQIAGLYAGQGGVSGAFKEAASSVLRFAKANPVAVASMAALGIAFAGLRAEINRTSDTQVSFGNVFQATLNVAARGIKSLLMPAVEAISPLFASVWDQAVSWTKSGINTIIGAAVGAYAFIKAEWSNLPAAFGDLAFQAANAFLKGIDNMIHKTLTAFNVMMAELGVSMRVDNRLLGLGIDNPFAGAANANGGQDAFNAAFNRDYVGEAFGAIRDEAIKLAKATGEDVSEGAKKAGKALKDAADKGSSAMDDLLSRMQNTKDGLSETIQFARDVTGGFFTDLRNGLLNGEGLWNSFRNAAVNAINKIADRLLNSGLDAIFNGLFNRGGGFLSGVAGFVSSLFGGGRASGGGMMPGKFYRVNERGQEFAMNAQATRRFRPQLEAMNRGQAPIAANQNNVQVTVINNGSGNRVRQETRRTSNGIEKRIFIEEVKRDMAQGGFDKQMGGFGVSPVPVRR